MFYFTSHFKKYIVLEPVLYEALSTQAHIFGVPISIY